jgi:hypothetical protein
MPLIIISFLEAYGLACLVMPATKTIVLMKWIFYKIIYAITALVLMKSMSYKLIYLEHRYLRKVDCSSFVMCLLLALAFPRVFLGAGKTTYIVSACFRFLLPTYPDLT